MYSDEKWISWIDQLAEHEYVLEDNFISEEHYRQIMAFFNEMEKKDQLKKAGIGSLNDYKIETSVRGDFIYWLDRERDVPLASFFELMDELTEKLKRYCYLSLSGSEFHIAKYPAGTHYEKHLDQFHERSNRLITVLIYLNEDWKPGDGGELKIYKENEEILIEPVARRLLVFKSDTIEHEVLKTKVPRYSLTGWLLRQPSDVGFLLG